MNDIDRILREDARVPLPDDGFAGRVMEALPPRSSIASAGLHPARAWLHPTLVFGSAALGCVLAVVLAPAGGSLLQGFADLAQLRALTPAAVTAIAIGGALLASALVLATDLD